MEAMSDLPPGVTLDMIPGNRPDDEAWGHLYGQMEEDCACPEDGKRRWDSQPGLLEACREVLVEMDDVFKAFGIERPRKNPVVDRLRAAIAKAEAPEGQEGED